MLRVMFRTLILFVLTSIALYLGSLPVLELLKVSASSRLQINPVWLVMGLTFLAGLVCLIGAGIYLKWVLKARQLARPLAGLEQWLTTTTTRLAMRSQITTPRIAIYPSRELNAFAIGPGRHHATIVLSEGLVHGLKLDELESVLAHEVSHIAHGDVQILAILQGVLNIVIYLPAQLIDRVWSWLWPRYRTGGWMYYCCVVTLQLLVGWLASLLIMRFSRSCEYRADQRAAKLVGLNRMQSALRHLHAMTAANQSRQLAAFGLSERLKSDFIQLFNSHPSLSERLRALRQAN